MIITIICNDNTCGIPSNIVQWINKNTDHSATLVYGSDPYRFGVGGRVITQSRKYIDEIIHRLNRSDIIIFNDPAVPGLGYHLYNWFGEEFHIDYAPYIKNQKLVRIANGTYYRNNYDRIYNEQILKYNMLNFVSTDLLKGYEKEIHYNTIVDDPKFNREEILTKWKEPQQWKVLLPFPNKKLKGSFLNTQRQYLMENGIEVIDPTDNGKIRVPHRDMLELIKISHFLPVVLQKRDGHKIPGGYGVIAIEGAFRYTMHIGAGESWVKEKWKELYGREVPELSAYEDNVAEVIMDFINLPYDRKIKHLLDWYEWCINLHETNNSITQLLKYIV